MVQVLHAGSVMYVHRPSAVGDGIRKDPVGAHVVFIDQVITFQPAALPVTGQQAKPLQIIVFHAVAPLVFQMIPYTKQGTQQFIPDLFCALFRFLADFLPDNLLDGLKIRFSAFAGDSSLAGAGIMLITDMMQSRRILDCIDAKTASSD